MEGAAFLAITEALAGAAIVGQGAAALHWAAFAQSTALPLAVSPLVSIALVSALFPLLRRGLARVDASCLCLERQASLVPVGVVALKVAVMEGPVVAPEDTCAASPTIADRLDALEGIHWLSSALTSFARGLNDTPKIVALASHVMRSRPSRSGDDRKIAMAPIRSVARPRPSPCCEAR
jgi:PiT family inorganic phosphate transporter